MNSSRVIHGSEWKKISIFFLGAYAVSGLFALPLILIPGLDSGIVYYTFMLLAQFGPFISAFTVAFYSEGTEGVRELVRRGKHWRFPWYIYLLVFTMPALFMLWGVWAGTAVLKITPIVGLMFPSTVLTALIPPMGEETAGEASQCPDCKKHYRL